MASVIWLLVNCQNLKEAKIIGRACLRSRRAVCFNVFKRELSQYFWTPRAGRIEQGKGALLILETLPRLVPSLKKLIKSRHSDDLPFIGSLSVKVERNFFDWVQEELK